MRLFFAFLLFALGLAARCPAAAIEAPVLTYTQKVEIVVAAKKDPGILELTLEQQKSQINVTLITDKDIDRTQAQKIAYDVAFLAKNLSLDDKSSDTKTIGKGLYDYRITINHVDGILLLSATKPADKKDLTLDPPGLVQAPLQVQPWTRADETARSSAAGR